MKQKHKFESIVAETLLIPLYYRAKESRRKNPILNDKVAEGLVDSLEYDYSRFDGAKLSEVGCVVRGWFFDRAVRRFIGKHANAVVVNVGCGLDTRFQRIGDGKAVFYDMDLPEVIALRRELIPEQPGNPYIAASLLETDWLDDLRRRHSDAHFIFVVEGVLMYFYEKQVKAFLHHV
ncbi:class I SAM-dependent methyltransferase, partial [Bacteroides ovatus]